jgi:hypothetical protein
LILLCGECELDNVSTNCAPHHVDYAGIESG